jgi:hypothetical protein
MPQKKGGIVAGFLLLKPKTPSIVEFHHICECGNKFVSSKISQCPKCQNKDFFSADEIEDNLDKINLKFETNDKLICYYEYPIFIENKIIKKQKIIFSSDNPNLTISKKTAKAVFKTLCEYFNIKLSYKLLKLYEGNYNYLFYYMSYLLKENKDLKFLYIVPDEKVKKSKTLDEYFNTFKVSKSVKKSLITKFLHNMKNNLIYNPAIDEFIIKICDDTNYKKELINLTHDYIFHDEINYELFEKIKAIYPKQKIFNFLKKIFKNKEFEFYNRLHLIKPVYHKNIEDFIRLSCTKEKKFPYYKSQIYKNLHFKTPKDSNELYSYSFTLKNCLKNYVEKIDRENVIFGVFKNKILKYAVYVNLKEKKIIEAKGIYNKDIPQNDMETIEEFIAKQICF